VQSTLLGELIENAELGAVAIDEGRYVAANGYACALTGYERGELIGRRVGELNPFSALPLQFAEIRRGVRQSGEVALTSKTGEEIRVAYRTAQTSLAGLSLLIAVFWRI
jgi:PAS domain S-box-containing protein